MRPSSFSPSSNHSPSGNTTASATRLFRPRYVYVERAALKPSSHCADAARQFCRVVSVGDVNWAVVNDTVETLSLELRNLHLIIDAMQREITDKTSAFCDGTSRYGVPENLTTG